MKDSNKPIIIFCQAPSDVAYLLTLYELHKDSSQISIYVINVKGTFKHLQSLDLNVNSLQFIPYPDSHHMFRDPRRFIKIRGKISRLQKQFRQFKDHEVYYSSNQSDWITFACIHVMRENNKIFTYDHYDTERSMVKSGFSVKNIIIRLVLYYITRVNLQLNQRLDISTPYYRYNLYGIIKYDIKLTRDIFQKYAYKLEDLSSKAILLYEENRSEDQLFIKYDEMMSDIIKRLKSEGYQIYIKPHPRVGYSRFLDDLDILFLPGFITGEFLPVEQFHAVLGIWTTSIAKISMMYRGIKTIALLEMFTPVVSSGMETMRDHLISQSEGHIKFAKDIKDLLKMLH